jgi:hypothetical protein
MAWSAQKLDGPRVEQAVPIGQVVNIVAGSTTDLAPAPIVLPDYVAEKLPLVSLQEVFVGHALFTRAESSFGGHVASADSRSRLAQIAITWDEKAQEKAINGDEARPQKPSCFQSTLSPGVRPVPSSISSAMHSSC